MLCAVSRGVLLNFTNIIEYLSLSTAVLLTLLWCRGCQGTTEQLRCPSADLKVTDTTSAVVVTFRWRRNGVEACAIYKIAYSKRSFTDSRLFVEASAASHIEENAGARVLPGEQNVEPVNSATKQPSRRKTATALKWKPAVVDLRFQRMKLPGKAKPSQQEQCRRIRTQRQGAEA
ncbi:hypothetical protein HPB51_010904 [Rhipicephalus microplus]|uniref:Uncharacterized protein n=1 Tax=Rhipicephalus microplus TaxID=6941 RepID=A0A9J6DMJ6_RHIMP|nr:hypothetical protein HPB51_010904 [Rhipicephalus microplus]